MSDLADTIDDLICSFESDGNGTMDTLIMYLFCWVLVGFVALAVGKFAYSRVAGYASRKSGNAATGKTAAASEPETATGDRKQSLGHHHHRGAVPPTPPISRKRLGSKSGRTSAAVAGIAAGLSAVPAAAAANKAFSLEQQQAHHHQQRPPPVATGNDPDSVRWTNETFKWLYKAAGGVGCGGEPPVIEYLLGEWITTLNEYTKKSFAEHGVGVEFVRFLPETNPPVLSNVFCELGVCENVTITCDCDCTPAMQLKAMRQKGDKVDVSHYRVNVNKLQARLNISCDTAKKRGQIKFDGWPKVKVMLAQVGYIKSNTMDEVQLQDVIMDIVTGAIRSTDVTVDLYKWSEFPSFTKSQQSVTTSPLDSYTERMMNSHTDPIVVKQGEKRLMVKVIKASGLGLKQGCFEPYCVIEVDDPFQKKQTSAKKNTSSPQWNENFIFILNQMTEEILFEVYDCSPTDGKQFMGLAIVSVEELLVNPCQRQVLSLQTRPYQDDSVSGTLTLEFIFLEDERQNVIFSRETTDFSNERPSIYNDHYLHNESVGNNANQTRKNIQDENKNKHISYNINTVFNNKDYLQTPSDTRNTVQDSITTRASYFNPQQKRDSDTGISVDRRYDIGYNNGIQEADRGRSRKKKRDFFGAMRTRFNKSKFRSKSIDASQHEKYDDTYRLSPGQARSISADGTRNSCEPSIDLLAPPRAGSARSSLSEMSGASGTSTGTYLNEASTLVLETTENNVKKHYLVPFTQARKSKWRRAAGVKLHIFNDHTFVAKHLSSSLNCSVCVKYFPRRIGKQGYECRDCLIKCHKECHVKVPTVCTNSKINAIDLNNLTVLPSISA